MESSGVRGCSGPRGVCYGEWSGVCCRDLPESSGGRDLPESSGAMQNLLQRVEQGGGYCRDLSESSDLSAGARLGCLMERDGSLYCQSRRSSDIFEAADESTVIRCLRC